MGGGGVNSFYISIASCLHLSVSNLTKVTWGKVLISFWVPLTPFSRSQGLDFWKKVLSESYLLKECMDFDQACTAMGHEQALIRFW